MLKFPERFGRKGHLRCPRDGVQIEFFVGRYSKMGRTRKRCLAPRFQKRESF